MRNGARGREGKSARVGSIFGGVESILLRVIRGGGNVRGSGVEVVVSHCLVVLSDRYIFFIDVS